MAASILAGEYVYGDQNSALPNEINNNCMLDSAIDGGTSRTR